MSTWVGVNGYEVEPIVLDGRQVLRVRQRQYLVAYCSTVAEVVNLPHRS